MLFDPAIIDAAAIVAAIRLLFILLLCWESYHSYRLRLARYFHQNSRIAAHAKALAMPSGIDQMEIWSSRRQDVSDASQMTAKVIDRSHA